MLEADGETLMDCVPAAPGIQEYVPPAADGVAVNVVLPPLHMVELFTVTVGTGFTVTVDVAVEEHPFRV